MIVIGLYGGVASGKSTVARLFGELGARVLSADEAVHEAYTQPHVRQAVEARFGPQIYTAEGTLERKALAAQVFADPQARRDLEEIVHPVVRERLFEEMRKACERDTHEAVVLDVPLLATSPLEEHVEIGVFVEASLAERERRAKSEREWSTGEVARRDAAQPPLEQRKSRCRFVVNNDTGVSEEKLREHVQSIWAAIRKESSEPQSSS